MCDPFCLILVTLHLTPVVSWGRKQYKDVVSPVQEIPLWRLDDPTTISSLQWDFLYWQDDMFILNRGPGL